LALGHQLDELVKNGFLKGYLVESQGAQVLTAPRDNQGHEIPVHGEIHTISGGFSGGGCTASQQKKYARAVMEIKIKKRKKPKMKMLKRLLAHHPFYLKGLQGANLRN